MEDDNWKNVQRKTFTKWLNTKITKPVNDLYADLQDGIVLCELIQKLSNARIVHNKVAITRFQKIENVQNALTFLHENNIKLINIGSTDIVDGSQKLILGLIWTIIKRFVVCKEHATDDGLLKWCRAATAGYDVEINNFGKSWQDGMAFNAVIHRFRPDLIDYQALNKTNKLENLENSFDIAEKSLGIPRLIDAEDIAMVVYPDEKCIMTYVSQFREKFGEFKDKDVQKKVDNFIFAYDKMNKVEIDFLTEQNEYDRLVREIRANNDMGVDLMEKYRGLYIKNQDNIEKLMWKRIKLYSLYGTMKTLNDFYKISKALPFKFLTEEVKNEIKRCEMCIGKVNAFGINVETLDHYIEILSSDTAIVKQVSHLENLIHQTKEDRIKKLVEEKLVIFSTILANNENKKLIQDGVKMFRRLDTFGTNKLKSDDVAEILEQLGLLNKENSKGLIGEKRDYTEDQLVKVIASIHDDGFDVKKIKKAFIQLSEDGKYLKIRNLNNSLNSLKDILIDKNGEEKIDIETMFDRLSMSK